MVCLLGGVWLFVTGRDRSSDRAVQMGELLFNDLKANAVEQITITTDDHRVQLKKKAHLWRVEDRFDYPADFPSIAALVKKIKQLKVGRTFAATPATLERLSLYDPLGDDAADGSKGTRVVLRDAAGEVLLDVVLGSHRQTSAGSGGHYLKRPGQATVYLVDKRFADLKTDPPEWLDQTFFHADADEVEKIICRDARSGRTRYVLQRKGKGETPVLMDAPPGKKVLSAKIDRLFDLTENLSVEDIADPALLAGEPADAGDRMRFEYRFFNGLVYTFSPDGPKDADQTGYYLTLAVDYRPPSDPAEDGETGGHEGTPAIAEKGRTLNEEISGRTFIISGWDYEAFVADPEDFFESAD